MLGSGPQSAIALSNFDRDILTSVSIRSQSASPVFAWFWRRLFRRTKGDGSDLPNTESGGRRGKCSAIRQNLKAIVPLPLEPSTEESRVATEDLEDLFMLTDDPSPKLWFYTDDLPLGVDQGELMIQVLQENESAKEIDVLETPVVITDISAGKSGIFSVDFNDFESLGNILGAGNRYKWYFSVICERERPSRNPSVSGWIRYEPYDEKGVSAPLNNRRRIEQYIENRYWHSALTLAAEAQCQPDPDGTNKANWVELVESIGFGEKVAQADILSCS
ncbi:MAG: DUF928 domain-containing protein [Cyanobacteria bacterium P01_D01_bin.1]